MVKITLKHGQKLAAIFILFYLPFLYPFPIKPFFMKHLAISVIFTLIAHTCSAQPTPLNTTFSKSAIVAAEQAIKPYTSGPETGAKVVKVVYFHGNDRPPMPHWEERLNRILADVSKFYQEAFSKYGIKNKGVPFIRSHNKYEIILVQGDSASNNYNTDAGERIKNEISKKASGKIDLSTDHILVFSALCNKRPDSTYVFHSPYWGTGSNLQGICLVADHEFLDSKLLTDTVHRMKFSEMAIAFKECSVAEFNSWYIGGIAHEMGHMFGLPHDNGNPSELAAGEISLMGQFGSRYFRGYLWGGKKSSVISAAGIMQLISHPAFTGHANSRQFVQADVQDDDEDEVLIVKNLNKGILIKKAIPTIHRPYACYTLLRTVDLNEYFNQSAIQTLEDGNELYIRFGKLPGGIYTVGIVLIYPDGSTLLRKEFFFVGSDGMALAFDGPLMTGVNMKALHDRLLTEVQTAETELKLKILKGLIGPNPASPADPKTTTGNRLFLSDAKWETARVGYQQPARNYYTIEAERTFFLENQGKIYDKGLFAHAPSVYSFNLDKKWKTFAAIAACRDDLIEDVGPVRFTVWGDGKLLYTSPVITTGQQTPVKIDVSQVKLLELKAESTAENNAHCWSVWLNPIVER